MPRFRRAGGASAAVRSCALAAFAVVVAGAFATPAKAELRWVPASNGHVPAGAVIGGNEPGRNLPVCRARYGQGSNVGVHPGKVVGRNCNIGWGGREITIPTYEVLVAPPAEIRWVAASAGRVPSGAVIGGSEPARQLFVCRARYGQGSNIGVHPGKIVAQNCNIGWGGREITLASYEVMVAVGVATPPPAPAAAVPAFVVRFAPQLRFDRAAGSYGYPMSAQTFFNAIDTARGGAFRPGVTRVENRDRNTLASGSIPTYYQVRRFGSQTRILYWWFYGYQHACFANQGLHHGDWERVMVTLNEAGSAIAAVTYWQHNNYYTRIAGPRDAPCTPGGTGRCAGSHGFAREGTHPVVYAGKIGHGSYHDSNAGGPGGCGYYDDFRNPASSADYMSTWQRLVDLDGNAEPWIAADRTASWQWGPDGVSNHPTQRAPTAQMRACEGSPTFAAASAGCYKSECLAGDDQASEDCLKECKPGYTNVGLTCNKGKYPWEWSVYGRLTGGNKYGYGYILPLRDAGLTRRRNSGAEWNLP